VSTNPPAHPNKARCTYTLLFNTTRAVALLHVMSALFPGVETTFLSSRACMHTRSVL